MRILCIVSIMLLASATASGKDCYVALTGSDKNPGTLKRPFASIQHAVNQMQPGDTCYIRGGVYHEAVKLDGKAGAKGNPITLTNYNGEMATLNGTTRIDSKWILDRGKVYKTKLKQDIAQLFVDGKLMTLARFPNALAFSDTVWHRTAARCQKGKGSTNGHVVDGGGENKSIAKTGISFNGCVALLNFGAHATGTRIVQNHAKGSGEFDYSPRLFKYKTTNNYFFEGGVGNAERAMLDMAEEWAFDESARTLYLWPDNGENPNGREIYGKTRTYGVTGDARTKHIIIDGLSFFATAFSFAKSDNIAIRNCKFEYYACSKRALGVLGPSETAQFAGSADDFCSNITIYNCEFSHADASALICAYAEDLLVENNLFHNIDYACANNDTGKKQGFQASITIRMTKVSDFVYRRNTLDTCGNAQGLAASRYQASPRRFKPDGYVPGSIRAPVFEYNFHTACGLLHTDGSSLYMAHANVAESVARYNWFIGNGQRDFRWDGDNRPLQGVHGNYYRNVMVGTKLKRMSPSGGNGARLKGSYHEVYNNLGLGRGGELNIAVSKGGNAKTVTRNNAASVITDNPIPGTSSNNYAGGKNKKRVQDMLRDPDNWDFRPRPDAVELIDKGVPVKCSIKGRNIDVTKGFNGKAPDLGAYELGDDVYWIPGRQETQASMPAPKNGGHSVKLDADLMYLIGLGGVKTRVYLGLGKDDLKLVAVKQDPQNIVKLSGEHALEKDKTYYWRVDTEKADGAVVEGEVWSFSTKQIQKSPAVSKKRKKKGKKKKRK